MKTTLMEKFLIGLMSLGIFIVLFPNIVEGTTSAVTTVATANQANADNAANAQEKQAISSSLANKAGQSLTSQASTLNSQYNTLMASTVSGAMTNYSNQTSSAITQVQTAATAIGIPATVTATTLGTALSLYQNTVNRTTNPVMDYPRDQVNAILSNIALLEQYNSDVQNNVIGSDGIAQKINLQVQVLQILQSVDANTVGQPNATIIQNDLNQLYGVASISSATSTGTSAAATVPTPLADNALQTLIGNVQTGTVSSSSGTGTGSSGSGSSAGTSSSSGNLISGSASGSGGTTSTTAGGTGSTGGVGGSGSATSSTGTGIFSSSGVDSGSSAGTASGSSSQ